jgi:hypothetical protein
VLGVFNSIYSALWGLKRSEKLILPSKAMQWCIVSGGKGLPWNRNVIDVLYLTLKFQFQYTASFYCDAMEPLIFSDCIFGPTPLFENETQVTGEIRKIAGREVIGSAFTNPILPTNFPPAPTMEMAYQEWLERLRTRLCAWKRCSRHIKRLSHVQGAAATGKPQRALIRKD